MESLYIRKTDGSPAVRLGEYRGLALSPDGRLVLAFPGGQDSSDRLLVVPAGAGEKRELRDASLRGIVDATWFPDARQVAVVNQGSTGWQLSTWDSEGSAPPRRLLAEQRRIESPVVAPDGRAVAATLVGVGPVLCPAAGGPWRRVAGGAEQDRPLRWSGDGRWLFVSRTALYQPNTPRSWVDRIEIATGSRQPWKELRPADPAGIYSIAAPHMTPDGKSYVYQVVASVGELYLAEGLR